MRTIEMRTSRKTFALPTIVSMEQRINEKTDYQRPAVWSVKQKQLLIDTILRGYDIPKFYWERVSTPGERETYNVVDGQQRLLAIWGFCAGEFALSQNTDVIDEIDCAGKRFEELDDNILDEFNQYQIDVVIVDDAIRDDNTDEISDMFLRLQNGTPLNAQEKRNAMPGHVRDLARKLGDGHEFFSKCAFSSKRYAYHHVAAQLVCIEREGGEPTNISKIYLDRLYIENASNKAFKPGGIINKRINRALEFLCRAFPDAGKIPELERYNVINLYCLASTLMHDYKSDGLEEDLGKWFINFEDERRDNDERDDDERNIELIEYADWIGHSGDKKEIIASRVDLLLKWFLIDYPEIELSEENDPQRNFRHGQRLAIYRRDNGYCQIKSHCNGEEKLPWNNWHADHKVPHSEGGRTIVANAQVACSSCNRAKSNNLE